MSSVLVAAKIKNYIAQFPIAFHERVVHYCVNTLQIASEHFLPNNGDHPITVLVLSNFSTEQLTKLLEFTEALNAEFQSSPLYSISAAVKRYYYHNAGEESTQQPIDSKILDNPAKSAFSSL